MKGGKTAEGRAKEGIEGTKEADFGYMGLTSGSLEALRGDFEVTFRSLRKHLGIIWVLFWVYDGGFG